MSASSGDRTERARRWWRARSRIERAGVIFAALFFVLVGAGMLLPAPEEQNASSAVTTTAAQADPPSGTEATAARSMSAVSSPAPAARRRRPAAANRLILRGKPVFDGESTTLTAGRVRCSWRGDQVYMTLTVNNNGRYPVSFTVDPRYRLRGEEGNTWHGWATTTSEWIDVRLRGGKRFVFDRLVGSPQGAGTRVPFDACRPQLQHVDQDIPYEVTAARERAAEAKKLHAFRAEPGRIRAFIKNDIIGTPGPVLCNGRASCTITYHTATSKSGLIPFTTRSPESLQRSLFIEVSDLYKHLFGDPLFQSGTITILGDLVTAGGKDVVGPVLKVTCTRSDANQIDWDNLPFTNYGEGLKSICDYSQYVNF